MSDLLKGNFRVQGDVVDKKPELTLEDQFEREALKRLGGSIAFVAKRKVVWADENAQKAHEPKAKNS